MNKNKTQNVIIVSLVTISIGISSLLWPYININFSNITGAQGAITKDNYSTDADTLRYIFFISIPLITFLLSYYFFKVKKIREFTDLIKFPEINITKNYNMGFFIIILFICILLQFLSLNLPTGSIDTFHDGELFSVTKNTILNNSYFKDTYTIHGFSDIFYPRVFWNIFGVETIGAGRLFFLYLIFIIKIFCVILSYQMIKFSSVNNKIVFFILFSLALISLSEYQVPINFSYFSYRDIYIIIYLIFLANCFLQNKESYITNIFLGLIPSFALLMHIDTGTFLYTSLLVFLIFLGINKKFKSIFQIFLSIIFSWAFMFLVLGPDELKSFFQNAITIILSMDYLHGTIYPEPFFSIGENKNGMRGTRGLLLQITAGLFVLYNFFNKKNDLSNGGKIFFLFIFFLSFIMYKNALGRSDSYHIRMSNDLPILINSYFLIHLIIKKFETKFKLPIFTNKQNLLFFVLLVSFFYYGKINFNKILYYKSNINNLVNLDSEHYIDKNKKDFVIYYKELTSADSCFQNFTDDLILLYLIEKRSCSKFVASWLASPKGLQEEYIKSIRKGKPSFIVYESKYFKVDNISMSERLENVNKYILENYEFYKKINGYNILKIKN